MRGNFSSLLLLTLLLPKSYFDDAMPQGILRVKKGLHYTTLCLGRQTTTVPLPEKDVSPSIFFLGRKKLSRYVEGVSQPLLVCTTVFSAAEGQSSGT